MNVSGSPLVPRKEPQLHLLDVIDVSLPTAKMTQSKADKINQVQSNLPLPEQPPVASDWQSADATKVNVGSGGNAEAPIGRDTGATSGLREPASKANEDLSNVGRQGKDNLSGPPKDAAAR
ncbi:hypothetical protein EsH8_V_000613 [Colletotrichum jinshuiense]